MSSFGYTENSCISFSENEFSQGAVNGSLLTGEINVVERDPFCLSSLDIPIEPHNRIILVSFVEYW